MVQFCLDFRYLIYRLKSVSIIFLSVFFPLYQITSLAFKMESYLQKKVPCRHSSKIRCVGYIGSTVRFLDKISRFRSLCKGWLDGGGVSRRLWPLLQRKADKAASFANFVEEGQY